MAPTAQKKSNRQPLTVTTQNSSRSPVMSAPAGFRPPPGLEDQLLPPPGLELETPTPASKGSAWMTPKTSSNNNSNKSSKSTHRLVWCYEFCHNDENRDRRHQIKQSTSEMKWSFSFFKKAIQFSKWLEEDRGEQYVLVMGWREAQPCFHMLSKGGVQLPMLSVILCDSRKQANRATNYIESLPANSVGKVEVHLQDEIPEHLLDGCIRKSFGPAEATVTDTSMPMKRTETASSVGGTTRSGSGSTTPSIDDEEVDSASLQQPCEQHRLQQALQALQTTQTPAARCGPLPVGRVHRSEVSVPAIHSL
eukprot:CAMPEP_0178400998 /NCGR_PEP_ID=MMETSP0689_2-20121128/16075_1 /TAXON_ID=160604 /ORGANISM="Amphidinium massartii, Strain CS-259" /LENGTH=306 /DNA_ID=CAMNT_0020021805 /DNA_START=86 /DNA_END=1006 /DNA_ORIENTATION=-